MGMTAGLYRASEAEIRDLLANPDTVGDFLERSTWAPPLSTVRPPGLLGWLLKLTPIYPETWTRAPSQGQSELGWLLDAFDDVRAFAGDTARAGDGLVGYVG
jgi:hypothetical protein